MSKIASLAAIAAVASAQSVLTTTPVTTTATVLPYTSVTTAPRVVVPPSPPRYLTGPGIQVAGMPQLPASYNFPLEQTTIDTNTGLLTRTQGTPLPPIPNLVKYTDGQWYQAPTNSWEYVGSPLQPYNNAGPFQGKLPNQWAMLVNENAVNLVNGEIFNNPYTPVPEIEVAFKEGVAYAVPRDPFQFMQSPFQPYVFDTNIPAPQYIPPMAVGGEIGLTQGYNPATMDILTGVQGLPLNYNYNLNTPAVTPEQQVGVIGVPGVPVL